MSLNNIELPKLKKKGKNRPRIRKRNIPRDYQVPAGWPVTKKFGFSGDSGKDNLQSKLTQPVLDCTPGYFSSFTPVDSDNKKNEAEAPKYQSPKDVPARPVVTGSPQKLKSIPSIHNKVAARKKHIVTQNTGHIYTVVHTPKLTKHNPIAPPKPALRLVTLVKLPEDNIVTVPKTKPLEDAIYVPDPEDPKLSGGFTAYMDQMKVWPWKNYVKEAVTISGIEDDAARTKANYKFLKSTFHRKDSRSYWYKITIVGYPPKATMETVLDNIIQYVYPERFIPCFVQFRQKECRFLVTRCSQALLNICLQGLSFTSDTGTKLYITISMSSESPDFDMVHAKQKRVRDRFNKQTGFLDLSNYKLSVYKGKMIMYFPLTHPENQMIIATKLKYFDDYPVKHLTLAHNRLRNIKDFNIHANYPSLRTLDLSNNNLSNTTTLSCLKGMCVRHVTLEGNPLCHDFVTQESYVNILKYLFPKLQSVDGITVAMKGYPVSQANYLTEQDAHPVVDTFLQTYFQLFDSEERRKSDTIANMYHRNAILTLTSSSLIVNFVGKIGMMIRHSKIVRERPRVSGIFSGVHEIVKFLNRCPETQHDPQSFKVDVPIHTENMTIVTVSGVFKSPTPGLLEDEPLIYFTRTFVLKPVSQCEYKITNDMLYMTKADEETIATSYTVTSPQSALSLDFTTTIPNPDLKNQLAQVFMKLTSLSKQQALRCLEVRNWNIRLGLEYFLLLENRNETHVLGGI